MSTPKKKDKDEEKEKKFLGLLTYKLDYDFEKNAVGVFRTLKKLINILVDCGCCKR
jgi:hypothetical protein